MASGEEGKIIRLLLPYPTSAETSPLSPKRVLNLCHPVYPPSPAHLGPSSSLLPCLMASSLNGSPPYSSQRGFPKAQICCPDPSVAPQCPPWPVRPCVTAPAPLCGFISKPPCGHPCTFFITYCVNHNSSSPLPLPSFAQAVPYVWNSIFCFPLPPSVLLILLQVSAQMFLPPGSSP